jgi:hypothetical protein
VDSKMRAWHAGVDAPLPPVSSCLPLPPQSTLPAVSSLPASPYGYTLTSLIDKNPLALPIPPFPSPPPPWLYSHLVHKHINKVPAS